MELTVDDFFEQRRFSKIGSITPNMDVYPLYPKSRMLELNLNSREMFLLPRNWFYFDISERVDMLNQMNITYNYELPTKEYSENDISKYSYNELYIETELNTDNLSNYIIKNQPLHITNISSYSCFSWNINSLKSIITKPFPVIKSFYNLMGDDALNYYLPSNNIKKIYNYSDFIRLHTIDPDNFYKATIPDNDTTSIFDGTIPLSPFSQKIKLSNYLTIDYAGFNTTLHYNNYDKLILQISGRRRFILFPPTERDNLYLYNTYPPDFLSSFKNSIKNNTVLC